MTNNVLLVVDLEGCSGVYDLKNALSSKQKMINEVEYIIFLLKKHGYKCISVIDCHNDGLSLKEYCENNGIEFIRHFWSLTNNPDYIFAIKLGFHGKVGSMGYFSHTIRPDISNVLLDNISVGEVTLVRNYLAYHRIPVLFISGDNSIDEELKDYNGVFMCTKKIGEKERDLDDNKTTMDYLLSAALAKQCSCVYEPTPIKVQLIGPNYSKFLPREIFCVTNDMVIYPNTVSFFNNLYCLCMFLNAAENYHNMRMKVLMSLFKKHDKQVIDMDVKASFLLKEKNWRALSDEEILYLTAYAEGIGGECL